MIGIFNRSYYEEVLIARASENAWRRKNIPRSSSCTRKTIWKERFESINNLRADTSHRNGTKVVKVFLHLSKDEQKKRFLKRIDHPRRENWKFEKADMEERKYWREYQHGLRRLPPRTRATSTRLGMRFPRTTSTTRGSNVGGRRLSWISLRAI